jgi:hypothetical protein
MNLNLHVTIKLAVARSRLELGSPERSPSATTARGSHTFVRCCPTTSQRIHMTILLVGVQVIETY